MSQNRNSRDLYATVSQRIHADCSDTPEQLSGLDTIITWNIQL